MRTNHLHSEKFPRLSRLGLGLKLGFEFKCVSPLLFSFVYLFPFFTLCVPSCTLFWVPSCTLFWVPSCTLFCVSSCTYFGVPVPGVVHHPPGRQLRQRGARYTRGPARVQQLEEEHHVHPLSHRAGGKALLSLVLYPIHRVCRGSCCCSWFLFLLLVLSLSLLLLKRLPPSPVLQPSQF